MTPDELRIQAMLSERVDQHARTIHQHSIDIAQLQAGLASLVTSRDLAKQERKMIMENQRRMETMIQRLVDQMNEGMTLFVSHTRETQGIGSGYRKSILAGVGIVLGTLVGLAIPLGIWVGKALGLL